MAALQPGPTLLISDLLSATHIERDPTRESVNILTNDCSWDPQHGCDEAREQLQGGSETRR